jgi:hypothetical protein
MKRRELLASKKAPWNRHFLHPNCQTPVEFDTFRKREPVQRIATWLKMRLSFPRNTRSPVNQCPFTPYWALPHCLCVTAAVPTLGSAQVTRVSRTDAMSEARDRECEWALLQQATVCCAT